MKYRKQIYLGYDSTGKQIRKWFYGETKAELKQNIEHYKEEARKLKNPSEVTFGTYSAHWFQTYKANRAKQTQDMYANALRKCELIDPIPIRKITRSLCQEVLNGSWKHPSAAEDLADTLKQIFKTAIADGIILANPADGLALPKKPQSKFYLLTEEDLDKIEKAPLRPADRLLVTILKVFGLRPAEALALQPTDFDFKNKVLHITKALELANDNRSQIKSTKTEATRDIPIPDSLIAPLREHFQANPGFLLFPKADGRPYTKSAYRRTFERIHKVINEYVINEKLEELEKSKKKTKTKEAQIRATDFFPEFTLYCFRHRRATDLYYLTQTGEISTKKAAALMGHSEIVFLKTYSHIDESKENLARIYDGLKVENL